MTQTITDSQDDKMLSKGTKKADRIYCEVEAAIK